MNQRDQVRLLKLAIQTALLGEVTRNLNAVTCGVAGNDIKIVAFFDGPVSAEDIARIQAVGAEVIAEFPEGFTIEEASLSRDTTEPYMLDFWAFQRAKD